MGRLCDGGLGPPPPPPQPSPGRDAVAGGGREGLLAGRGGVVHLHAPRLPPLRPGDRAPPTAARHSRWTARSLALRRGKPPLPRGCLCKPRRWTAALGPGVNNLRILGVGSGLVPTEAKPMLFGQY